MQRKKIKENIDREKGAAGTKRGKQAMNIISKMNEEG